MEQVSKQETEELLKLLNIVLDKKVEGDVVELGCYKGDTSILFQKVLSKTTKNLYLYDSFAGLPEKTAEDSSSAGDAFKSGELFVTKREVVEKFKKQNLPLPKIKKAFFSELDQGTDLPDQICFAFLDSDLYSSIKTSFALVSSKISKQGIIVVHDYDNPELPGSSRAVDEFLLSHKNYSFIKHFSLAILVKS